MVVEPFVGVGLLPETLEALLLLFVQERGVGVLEPLDVLPTSREIEVEGKEEGQRLILTDPSLQVCLIQKTLMLLREFSFTLCTPDVNLSTTKHVHKTFKTHCL